MRLIDYFYTVINYAVCSANPFNYVLTQISIDS